MNVAQPRAGITVKSNAKPAMDALSRYQDAIAGITIPNTPHIPMTFDPPAHKPGEGFAVPTRDEHENYLRHYLLENLRGVTYDEKGITAASETIEGYVASQRFMGETDDQYRERIASLRYPFDPIKITITES